MSHNPNEPLFSAVAWTTSAAGFLVGTALSEPGPLLFTLRVLTTVLAAVNAVIWWKNYMRSKQEEQNHE